MKRLVQPELLDTLPPDNPRAIRSRQDLQRINWWMGNKATMARVLEKYGTNSRAIQITEIGAGDGNMMVQVARRLSKALPKGKVTLLDLKASVSPDTLGKLESLGWEARAVVTDVFEWSPANGEIVIANLFLHHFDDAQLVSLFQRIASGSSLVIAIEPRRARWPLFCSRMLWSIGCNDITRHDAVVSVRAGFCDDELSSLWPDKASWHLTEQSTGLFGHLFVARKFQ